MEDAGSTKIPVISPYRLFWGDASLGERYDLRGGWYYDAREGVQGPFKTQEEALANLATMIRKSSYRRRE